MAETLVLKNKLALNILKRNISHCRNRCQDPVCFVSFSMLVHECQQCRSCKNRIQDISFLHILRCLEYHNFVLLSCGFMWNWDRLYMLHGRCHIYWYALFFCTLLVCNSPKKDVFHFLFTLDFGILFARVIMKSSILMK